MNTPVPKASVKTNRRKKFPARERLCRRYQKHRRSKQALGAASKFYFQKAGKTAKKKKKGKKKVHTKAENRHSTKLATSTPLVLSLWPNLLTAANPGLTLHRNERWILAEWAYWPIVLTGLFWGNFLAYCMKKNILRTEIKWRLLATVGRRRSLGGFGRALR